MTINRLNELEDGEYKVLNYPDLNKRPRLVALEKLNSGRKKNNFLIMERAKDDQPKFLIVGSKIIKKTVDAKPVIKIQIKAR